MLCEHCHQKMIQKRSLWNLLEPETHHLCEKCFQRYPLLPTYEVIPIDKGVIHLFTVINKTYPVLPIAYQSFLKNYYKIHQLHFNHLSLFIFDYLDETMLDFLDHISFGDLMVVRLYKNKNCKGEKL